MTRPDPSVSELLIELQKDIDQLGYPHRAMDIILYAEQRLTQQCIIYTASISAHNRDLVQLTNWWLGMVVPNLHAVLSTYYGESFANKFVRKMYPDFPLETFLSSY